MSGHGFTIFDTAVGRCGIAWGGLGILGVQLPEAREAVAVMVRFFLDQLRCSA